MNAQSKLQRLFFTVSIGTSYLSCWGHHLVTNIKTSFVFMQEHPSTHLCCPTNLLSHVPKLLFVNSSTTQNSRRNTFYEKKSFYFNASKQTMKTLKACSKRKNIQKKNSHAKPRAIYWMLLTSPSPQLSTHLHLARALTSGGFFIAGRYVIIVVMLPVCLDCAPTAIRWLGSCHWSFRFSGAQK